MGCASSSRRRGRHGGGGGGGVEAGKREAAAAAWLPEFNDRQLASNEENGATLLAKEQMLILLVFRRDDSLCCRLAESAKSLGLACDSAHSKEQALEKYIGRQHDLVLVDHRLVGSGATAAFDSASLIKSLRAITHSGFSTFVAVTGDCEFTPSEMKELLQQGFDKRFKETTSDNACCEELLTIMRNNFRYQQRLGAFAAVFTALDRCVESVEICDDRFRVQYVNSSHERQFGVSSADLVGRSCFEVLKCEKSEEELSTIAQQLRRGKEWCGILRFHTKSSTTFEHQSHYFPVKGRRGKVQQFVCIKQLSSSVDQHHQHQQHQQHQHSQNQQQQQNSHHCITKDSTSTEVSYRQRRPTVSDSRKASIMSMCSGGTLDGSLITAAFKVANRKDSSGTRLNSITVEAPIHRIIHLLNSAQESCGPAAAATLEKVLDILHRTTDLYMSEVPNSSEDRMTADYVDGLMTGGTKPVDKKRQSLLQPRQNSSANIDSLSEVPDQLRQYLEGDEEWSFDIIELERVTQKKPMVHLAMKTLRRFNVCQFLQCSEETMLKWLHVMQDHYRSDNFYHNATHGADVMQSSAFFLERDRIKSVFDEMDEVASLLGALVHDLDHPGRTNPFLINSQHRLALLYNDISVLESHHVSLAFQLSTRDDRINIFKNMSRNDYKTLRQSMIDIVLATEMAKHFEHVGKFTNQIVAPLVAKEDEEGAEQITEEEALEMLTKPENRTLIKRVLIKCSDVSNPCRSLKLCKEWASRISEEYFQQTDEEKSQGLPIVMPVFDRSTCNMPHSQTSFIDFFLREMFTAWHAFCDVPELLENLNNNYEYWTQLADDDNKDAVGGDSPVEQKEEEEEEEATDA